MTSSKEIRNAFFEFFREKDHVIVPSAPLLPIGDQTLLFTNAGMNQFKDVFLGQGKRDYTRAADTQKCMRVSGKHNDLDDVGRDTYHHTFFEMLGNWSFGDYYKKEAISWAWELLTRVFTLPGDKLWATVFREDQEAFELWKSCTEIDHSHILYFDEKDNFWEMGDTGPCGPCSEIHIDLGPEACDKQGRKGHTCAVNGDCARYIELWNLVFIQYDRQDDGSLKNLPEKHVDTGMGFERLVAVLQGKHSNYETDLFVPIMDKIAALSGCARDKQHAVALRVIADHIRSLSFSIADGIMPSNEGRGYVLRRILRRALRFAQTLGFEEPFLAKLLPVLFRIMGTVFPELERSRARIEEVLTHEEERYFSTLKSGMAELERIIAEIREAGSTVLEGRYAFQLYDSMGFPVDICAEVAEDEGLQFDQEGFEALMEEQKKRGRSSWKGKAEEAFAFLPADMEETTYLGETGFSGKAKALLLFDNQHLLDSIGPEQAGYVLVDKTPFYAEGGGQVSDTGTLAWKDGHGEVLEVFRRDQLLIHKIKVTQGTLKKGTSLTLEVAEDRKRAIARNHTATHLLQEALIRVLGEHVAQNGSLVEVDRLRFDFTHFKAIPRHTLDEVEQIVNRVIRSNTAVNKEVMHKDAAVEQGAKAFFGEKYGEEVRVVSVGDYSLELCGGTHVEQTGDIGLFLILGESSIASGVRRIEAVTGQAALDTLQGMRNTLTQVTDILNAAPDQLPERVTSLNEKVRRLEKEVQKRKSSNVLSDMLRFGENAEQVNGVRLVIARVDDQDARVLRNGVDALKNKLKDCIVLLGGVREGKCILVLGAAGQPLEGGFDAKNTLNQIAALVGGSGGGRSDMAQAGGKDAAAMDKALTGARDIIKQRL